MSEEMFHFELDPRVLFRDKMVRLKHVIYSSNAMLPLKIYSV